MVKPIDMSMVEQALKGFTIPPQPEVLIRIKHEIDQDDPNIDTIAQLINTDIGMAGFTLKVVNSAFFGLSRKLSSIEHACKFLGLNRVIKLVTSILLRFTLSEGKNDGFTLRQWNSAMDVATAAMLIAKHLRLGQDCADDCYTLGLFHNAGISLIHAQFPDYAKVMTVGLGSELSYGDTEQRYFNVSHETLGFMIAQSWGLSKELANVIAYHHQYDQMLTTPDMYEKRLFAILKLAEHMTEEEAALFNVRTQQEWQQHGIELLDILKLDELQLIDIGDALLENGVDNAYHA